MNRRAPSIEAIRRAAVPFEDVAADTDALLDLIGDAQVVLLGEATHGTHEFYAARARISQRLIVEKDFSAVAIEGDWPDAYRVNRYVQGTDRALAARDALAGFKRFPTWMWRNEEVVAFVDWLRHRNAVASTPENRAGFYGLDLYSLHASIEAVIDYLDNVDPVAARGARHSYGCFDQFGRDTDTYAWATGRAQEAGCEDAVVRQLLLLRARRDELLHHDGTAAADEFFYAEQNARLVRNAETYYRTMFHGRAESWNVRDRHMAETLDELLGHLRRRGQPPKVIVWAHNSHVGDARATAMGDSGELTLGQLVRERLGEAARLIGFTTFAGSVVAASDWGEAPAIKTVRPALASSYEHLFHLTGLPRFFLPLTPGSAVSTALAERHLERAIGVIYRPATERHSHYFEASLPAQFDGIVHFDTTEAVAPLERGSHRDRAEIPETFPTGV